MTLKHTPGPWKVFEASWCKTFITAPGFDHGICGLDINHATEESQESDSAQMAANARLIAAAPELLDALLLAVSRQSYKPGDGPDWWEIGRAAIAKATGAS